MQACTYIKRMYRKQTKRDLSYSHSLAQCVANINLHALSVCVQVCMCFTSAFNVNNTLLRRFNDRKYVEAV
jgi:hypothetical protein